MGEKIIVGPITRGLRNGVTPFVIDNDSFPVLINAYQWRGRIKRKRGTSLLGRLQRVVAVQAIGNITSDVPFILYNVVTPIIVPEVNAAIVPGSVIITILAGPIIFTDNGLGVLISATLGNSGTINYLTGSVTITTTVVGPTAATATFRYFPNLPVMGLEDLTLEINDYPETLAFDTKYSYQISTVFPYEIHDVNFYKNPASLTYPGYTQKATDTAFVWNGQDYQQFWTVNYQGALWATNGVKVPFDITNIGMQFVTITAIGAIVAGPPAFATITTNVNHGLVIGDFVFINEVVGVTGINFQTGYVTAVPAANQITVEFPNATLAGGWISGGIVQYLTNQINSTLDGIRWYDGDPTVSNKGWVNFAPPLSREPFSIADRPSAIYYLAGAKIIAAFKDRLLFIGPVIQSSSAGVKFYLQDTVIYSQNGTPYYTASFTGDPSLVTTVFFPILVPDNQIAAPNAWWGDQTGFGGFITAGIDQPINTVANVGDVLILGFTNTQTKLVYSSDDILPFNFFLINSELGSSSTFSVINMDRGCLTRGDRGYVATSQTNTDRIDLEIPDEVFRLRLLDNGNERVCAQRDFINEWIYFTYPSNTFEQENSIHKFPTKTLQYNYRDNSWGLFTESYTTYGQFRKRTGYTWATIGTVYPTWSSWNEPWNSGASTLLQPKVIAGNQQGFVLEREDGTNESVSLFIDDIVGSVVTSPAHCLELGDYITIEGAVGTVGAQVNGKIFTVGPPVTTDTFLLTPTIVGGTYTGGGLIKKMYVPFIQTKQFPTAWGDAKKTRLGPQQYLLETTAIGQITLLIFLSQDANNPWNLPPILPQLNSTNDSLIYSTVLYTCPESTNLGLTAANINLQMVTAVSQAQTWHRINTSLLGDTVQVGFTLSDEQMRNPDFLYQFAEIGLHSFILDVNPSMILA